MVDGLLEMTSVLGSLMGEDGLSGADLVEGNGVLLDDFDGDGFGCGKVPDLFAFGLCFLEGACDGSSVEILLGFA